MGGETLERGSVSFFFDKQYVGVSEGPHPHRHLTLFCWVTRWSGGWEAGPHRGSQPARPGYLKWSASPCTRELVVAAWPRKTLSFAYFLFGLFAFFLLICRSFYIFQILYSWLLCGSNIFP